MVTTADLYDERGAELTSCETQFRSFGGRNEFTGIVTTIRCANDNGLVKRVLTSEDGHGRVLVVDDERPLAQLIAGYLEQDGFEVALAFDGPTAVRTARALDPDVVVLDLGLPGLDGIVDGELLGGV